MRESKFKKDLKARLDGLFPGCVLIDLDPSKFQGVPDLLVLYGQHWAMLEVKAYPGANIQPNQEYYVTMFNELSFAAFIYPENEEEVLYALQQTFGNSR